MVCCRGQPGGLASPACSPLVQGGATTRKFGFNWTSPDSPLDKPFDYMSGEQLGTKSFQSSHVASMRSLPAGGFIVGFIPFFSDVLLPEQRGTV